MSICLLIQLKVIIIIIIFIIFIIIIIVIIIIIIIIVVIIIISDLKYRGRRVDLFNGRIKKLCKIRDCIQRVEFNK